MSFDSEHWWPRVNYPYCGGVTLDDSNVSVASPVEHNPGAFATAAAIRFTEPDWTSPTANAPGTLVSNSPLAPSASLPVGTKP
jgi:hypothetical protein